MKLEKNQYIKIKDIDHLKRLCEENGILGVHLENELYKYNKSGLTFFTGHNGLIAGSSGYTEVFDEPQEKKMRYFVVFAKDKLIRIYGEKYPSIKSIKDIYGDIDIYGIDELSQSDYEDFIR